MNKALIAGVLLCGVGFDAVQADGAGFAAPANIQATGLAVDSRGPIVNKGMAVEVSEDGIQAPGYSWKPFPPLETWSAKWIGYKANSDQPPIPNSALKLLRKTVELKDGATQVIAYLSGSDYIVFVNGIMADRGPADAGRDFSKGSSRHWFYEGRDLTNFFHKGKNTIAVEIVGGNNFILEGTVHYSSGSDEKILTDDTWKGSSSSFLLLKAPGDDKKKVRYYFDAAKEPVGWQLPNFDDSKWSPAGFTTNPDAGSTFVESELPPLMEARYPNFDVKPFAGSETAVSIPEPFTSGSPVVFNQNGAITVHFARIMSGRCSLLIDGVDGAEMTVYSNETAGKGGRIYELKLRDGLQTFETPDYYALGAATIEVSGLPAGKTVKLVDFAGVAVSQPVAYQGSFTCSDDELNILWKCCRWSTQICMMTHHLDSPQHQEPICDYGDYLIEDLVNDTTMDNNQWLARQDLRKFSWILDATKYQTFHTSYIFYWLQSLMNYYQYTGDKETVKELAPIVHGVIAQFTTYLGDNGIISKAPNYMFMDWVSIHGIPCHHPPAVIGQGYMTALFINALEQAAQVSELTGDSAHATEYRALRAKVVAAYNAELWDEKEGLYRDGKVVNKAPDAKWLPADSDIETFSTQNNTFAVLYDIAPKEKQAAILDKLMAQPSLNATPYFLHFTMNAMAHAGVFDKYGTKLMRDGWSIAPETQTVLEMGHGGDHSHGWISSPTFQMMTRILGVEPLSPGFDTLRIAPTLCDLTFAKGSVPTPHGLLSVDWKKQEKGLLLAVTVPVGTEATTDVPLQGLNLDQVSVKVGNDRLTSDKMKFVNGSAEFELKPGTWEIQVVAK